jgi:hypothetical protein
LLEESKFELVRFQNQPKGTESVPDAIIQASVRILVETKIQRGMVSLPQIKRHLRLLDAASEEKKVLSRTLVRDPRWIIAGVFPRRKMWEGGGFRDGEVELESERGHRPRRRRAA